MSKHRMIQTKPHDGPGTLYFPVPKTVNGFKSKLERERAKKMGLFLD